MITQTVYLELKCLEIGQHYYILLNRYPIVAIYKYSYSGRYVKDMIMAFENGLIPITVKGKDYYLTNTDDVIFLNKYFEDLNTQ